MKDSKPPTSREHPFGHHPSYAGDLAPELGFGEWGEGRRVYIPVGKMPEKIAGGSHAKSSQGLGAPLSNSLEELDRRIETVRRWRGARGHPL